ncbi:MAG: DUF1257 domain-containing protein [Synechococcaceae cyanobacterium]|nr:DUF1257 domain-containing protein [Synechococcaceae cyanobacterium]
MSHFSTIRTALRDRQALVEALTDLGHPPSAEAAAVRGYRGQTVIAELAVPMACGGDIGFRWDAASDSYELVADLELWKQPQPVERFLARLHQRYALRAILAASVEEGFQVSEQTDQADGSIELVVTRWDG